MLYICVVFSLASCLVEVHGNRTSNLTAVTENHDCKLTASDDFETAIKWNDLQMLPFIKFDGISTHDIPLQYRMYLTNSY